VHLEKALLRKVGEAIKRFDMIREGDRIAVGISGGKDSIVLMEALRLLHRRSPVRFSLCAFTIEQGKFVRPVEPVGEFLRARGIEWVHYNDGASIRLIDEKPEHGCDLCSRYRRRAVYEVARGLGANTIALGHTADDFCESLLRNAMYNGRISALPAVTRSRKDDVRIIRPLVYVSEEITRAYAESLGVAIVPCVCSFKTGTVRRSIREIMDEPGVKASLLSAIGNIDTARLLDTRYFDVEKATDEPVPELVQL
jgi:tRNA 2-thiocytidine biosynthesis protein TtcA